jgi:hypothetical protein
MLVAAGPAEHEHRARSNRPRRETCSRPIGRDGDGTRAARRARRALSNAWLSRPALDPRHKWRRQQSIAPASLRRSSWCLAADTPGDGDEFHRTVRVAREAARRDFSTARRPSSGSDMRYVGSSRPFSARNPRRQSTSYFPRPHAESMNGPHSSSLSLSAAELGRIQPTAAACAAAIRAATRRPPDNGGVCVRRARQ